ncbi:hypothetical protein KL937_002341 [Ogataea polymorpha]|nr:hypothetical protein KL937_002341 [Ogataea polymorpha]KAG7888763.1 hypothetical protein KL936_003150 [Ogataea polymorpha]KAG7935166.1 hypothetical protein KL904_002859 [Ogataea polymorpha]
MSLITPKDYPPSVQPRTFQSVAQLGDKSPLVDQLSLCELKLKTWYNFNLQLMDSLSNTSFLLVLIHHHHKLLEVLEELFNTRRLVNFTVGSVSSSCFRNSVLSNLRLSVSETLVSISSTYTDIFKHAHFLDIENFKCIYSKINKETFKTSTNNEDQLVHINFEILASSKSFFLFKKLNGVFDSDILRNEELVLLKSRIDKSKPKYRYSFETEDDAKVLKSRNFRDFHYRRLTELRLLNKRIFS